ncbi:unnamed protein product [Acidithrix sp. C25]|nr:unnamed protein product [Acidithrix sp. C25]
MARTNYLLLGDEMINIEAFVLRERSLSRRTSFDQVHAT